MEHPVYHHPRHSTALISIVLTKHYGKKYVTEKNGKTQNFI
jgi:hypothetical protein